MSLADIEGRGRHDGGYDPAITQIGFWDGQVDALITTHVDSTPSPQTFSIGLAGNGRNAHVVKLGEVVTPCNMA